MQQPDIQFSGSPAFKTLSVHPSFGVEITGLDLRQSLSPGLVSQIREMFEEYSVLVFPVQNLSALQQVRSAEYFGPVDPVKVGSVGAGSKVSENTNVGPDGAIVPPDHKRALTILANQQWHSDSSFRKRPSLASLLSAEVIPPTGGDTQFISMRAVYDSLPDDLKAKVQKLSAVHSYATSRDKISPDLMNNEEREALPPVVHRLVQTNPVNHKPSLFIGSHVSQIVELEKQDSRELIDTLMAFATQARFVYSHQWQKGDLVLWDNRSVIHRGGPWDMARHKRTMVHTSVRNVA